MEEKEIKKEVSDCKKKVGRRENYYTEIITEWKSKGVITTLDLYKMIETLSFKNGLKHRVKSNSMYLDKLEKILKESGIEYEKVRDNDGDGRIRSRGRKIRNYYYSLKEDLDVIKSKIEKWYENQSKQANINRINSLKKRFDVTEEEKSTKKAESESGKSYVSSVIGIRPRTESFLRMYSILNYLYTNKTNEVSIAKVKEIVGLNWFSESSLKSYVKSFQNIGITIDASYHSIGYKKTFIKVTNVEDSLLKVKKAAENLNIPLPTITEGKLKNINLSNKGFKEPLKVIASVTEEKIDSSELYYAIGGIIMKHDMRPIDIDALCRILKEGFKIQQTKKEILEAIKNIPEFEKIQNGIRIGLKDKKFSWEDIKEKYGPHTRIKTVYARLTIPEDELKNLFGSVEKLSVIGENDAVYRIGYEDSKHSLKSWTMLYRKFRGADQIFDEVLKSEIELEIKRIDCSCFNGILAYEIEEDRF